MYHILPKSGKESTIPKVIYSKQGYQRPPISISSKPTKFCSDCDSGNGSESSTTSHRLSSNFSSERGSFEDQEDGSESATYESIPAQVTAIPNETLVPHKLLPAKATCSFTCGCSGNSEEQNRPNFIKIQYLVITVFVAMFFSCVSLSVVSVDFMRNYSRAKKTSKEGNYEICLPCDELPDGDETQEGLKRQLETKDEDGGKELCCARTSGQMSALLQLIISQQKSNSFINIPPSMNKIRFSPVCAHKYLLPWSESESEENNLEKSHHLKLNPIMDYTMQHSRHVIAKNNSLQIVYRGLYYIYSSVYFKQGQGGPCSQLLEKTWGHFIRRYSQARVSTSGILVHSAHTCCESCAEDHHTSYAAGVFHMEAGDSIFVDVTGSGLVAFEGEGTYLGLFMLGSTESTNKVNGSKG